MTGKQLATLASVILLTVLTICSPVAAKPQFQSGGSVTCDNRYPATCDRRGWTQSVLPFRVSPRRAHQRSHRIHKPKAQAHRHAGMARAAPAVLRGEAENGQPHRQATRIQDAVSQVLPHPAGCPRRLFCGCGAAVKVFGAPIRSLWRAAEWFRFPRAEPAPGMVAVRRGHVFVIEQVIGPRTVIAYDANSGRRLTRRHVRSLAGYSVRDPRGGTI